MGMVEQLPAHEKWCFQGISWFTFLVCVAFALPILISLFQPMSFLTFTFLISSLAGGEWARACVVLSCWMGLKHDTL